MCRNTAILLSILSLCIVVCYALSHLHDDNNPFAVPIFILGVAAISRFSDGYVCGIAASVIGVVCVNYMFTYPFWVFDMTLSGYPLTFTVMLLVSVIISTLTTQVKHQQRLMYEVKSESMRANLLRAVSHDIRTPLSSILGATSTLLESQDLDETARRDLLLEVHKDAQWLVRVTENILSVTKFSADGVKLKLTEEVVEEIVGSAITKFRKTGGSISIQVHKPQDILLVPMEATLIEQVLLNLLENVVFHGKCATRIDIDIAEEPSRVCFHVSDNGAGISEGILPHLFDGSYAAQDGTTAGTWASGCRSASPSWPPTAAGCRRGTTPPAARPYPFGSQKEEAQNHHECQRQGPHRGGRRGHPEISLHHPHCQRLQRDPGR